MSHPFSVRIIAKGTPDEVERLSAFLMNEWVEMKSDNTILNGFRWVQSNAPTKSIIQSCDSEKTAHFDFLGDGTSPDNFAFAIGSQFPDLRISLISADTAFEEWLASVTVVHKGAWISASFNFGERGFFKVKRSEKLISVLMERGDLLHSRIDDEGKFSDDVKEPVAKSYVCGLKDEVIFSHFGKKTSRSKANKDI